MKFTDKNGNMFEGTVKEIKELMGTDVDSETKQHIKIGDRVAITAGALRGEIGRVRHESVGGGYHVTLENKKSYCFTEGWIRVIR